MKILLLGNGVATRGCKRLLERNNIPFVMKEIDELDEYKYDLIVKSPGISLLNAIFLKLQGEIISDIELAYRIARPRIIAVTGSNGKTSVVSMLQHVLSKKYKVIACGNIGYTLADAVVDYPNYDYYIVECSSYQLESIRDFYPDIAVVLNISLCHIDHHGTLKNYVNSKLNMASHLGKHCYFVYNKSIPYISSASYSCKLLDYSTESTASRIYRLGNRIYYGSKKIFYLNEENRTDYKCENIMAIAGVLIALNQIKLIKHIKSFKGVEFRFQKIDNEIYNNAKSTNCDSTRVAISSLHNVHLICGGYDRGIPIILDAKSISRLKHVYAYGQTAVLVNEYCLERDIKCDMFITLKEAFFAAMKNKKAKDTILYSPMFASYDQYNSYIERGNEFNKLYLDYKKNKPIL